MARRRRSNEPDRPPLPPRDGVDAARVRLPLDGCWRTVVGFLVDRTGEPDGIARRVRAGEVVLHDGTTVEPDTPYRPGATAYLYRDLPDEVPVPFPVEVLHRDERIVVVDKPHFLATMPRGRHVAETVLVRLRRELDLPDLAPAHRLDRLTAGVLVLTTSRDVRAAYQTLFACGEVEKTYLALAPVRAGLDLPLTVRNRVVKERGVLQARVVPGEPNAVTHLDLVETSEDGGLGRYRLRPRTGQTHQLRVHLADLGIPIVGDPLYPVVREPEPAPDDFSEPLQLLAQRLAFTDPVTGERLRLESQRTLRRYWTARGAAAPRRPTLL